MSDKIKNEMFNKKYINNFRKHHKLPMLRGAAKRKALKNKGITISAGTQKENRFLRKLIALEGTTLNLKITPGSSDYINILDIKPEV